MRTPKIGHLLLMTQKRRQSGPALLVYNYAVRGHAVADATYVIQTQFIPEIGSKPDWAPWKSSDSLFCM